ncbi:hypothetical protein [Streptomyces sp. NPDC093149]|uniref:hypothetical protein n=1 Tax=Streptomyces sp. NPDC093149 TaxID=3366031 RepID=UPI003829DE1D
MLCGHRPGAGPRVPVRLAQVFGLDEKTALRYADSARALLERATETSRELTADPWDHPSGSGKSTFGFGLKNLQFP